MTRALQQSLHREVHSASSLLFPQLAKLSQKKSSVSCIRYPHRSAHSRIAPGLGETRLFWVYANPRILKGINCSPVAPRGNAWPWVGWDFLGMRTLSRRWSSDLSVLPNLDRNEGCPFFVTSSLDPLLTRIFRWKSTFNFLPYINFLG